MQITVIYIYIYIYCHQRQTVSLNHNSSVSRHAGHFKLGSKLFVRLSILPLNLQATDVSSGIIMHYALALFCLHFALPDIYIYIYIYIVGFTDYLTLWWVTL